MVTCQNCASMWHSQHRAFRRLIVKAIFPYESISIQQLGFTPMSKFVSNIRGKQRPLGKLVCN